MGKYQPYPEYREGNGELLPRIPSHWMTGQVKYAHSVVLGKMLQSDAKSPTDMLLPYLRAANVAWGGVNLTDIREMWFSPSERKALKLELGDVVISEGGDVGRSAIWQGELPECYFQNAINRARPKGDHNSRYLYYWMSFIKEAGYIDIICNKSTIPHYTAEKVQASPFAFPPATEQSNISAFLDHETAKIDRLIAKQERLIELLKEKRQAVISHAVTKGLNPDVPMKESGVEWLGKVPAHWKVTKVAHHYEVILGKMLDEKRITGEHLAPYLRNTDVQWDRINVIDLPTMDFSPADRKKFELRKGDLLVCEGGEVGRAALWEGELRECFYQKALHRMRPLRPEEDVPRFMFYLLWHASEQGRFTGSEGKATIAHLPAETLRQYRFTFPPTEEQAEIASFLDSQNRKMDVLMEKAKEAVALLQEHRTALISAAVTGKIDVRGWQQPNTEPQEAAEAASA